MRTETLLPMILKQLRLSSLISHWQPLAEKARAEGWPVEQYLMELCQLELDSREEKRLQRYLKEASLPAGNYLDNYDFSAVEGITKAITSFCSERAVLAKHTLQQALVTNWLSAVIGLNSPSPAFWYSSFSVLRKG